MDASPAPRHAPLLSPGLRYMALSALFFSLMSLFVKIAGRTFPTMELVFARAVVVSALALVDIRRRGARLRSSEWRLLSLRGLVGLAALTCFYFAVVHLPLAEVTVIHFTNPVFTAIIAAVFLAEGLRSREVALTLVSLAGVVLVARPSAMLAGGDDHYQLAVAAALAGAILAAVAYSLVRHLRREDAMVIVFYFAAVSVVVALPLMASVFVMPRGWEWLTLLAVGVATFLGQLFMTLGLQRERAARATAVGYLQIVFAATWGILFFGEVPRLTTLAGAAVIVGSTLLLARLREHPPAGARGET